MKPIKFNPNDPKLWKDFDPTEQADEFVDGKSQGNINRATANRINAQDPNWREARDNATSTDEYKANLKAGKEKFWENAPDSHRKHIAKKAAEAIIP